MRASVNSPEVTKSTAATRSGPARRSKLPRSITPPYSRGARTPSPRNRGQAILRAGGACLGSALQGLVRLLGAFPESRPELGGVFGLVTGDPDPVTPSRAGGSRLRHCLASGHGRLPRTPPRQDSQS